MSKIEKLSVLLIEDNDGDARLVRLYLKGAEHHNFDLTHVTYLVDAKTALKNNSFNIILLDLSLPDASGIDTVTAVSKAAPYTAIVVMTGIYDALLAVNAIAAGAQDFLVKGEADSAVLERTIINAMQRAELHKQLQKAQQSHSAVMESSNDAIITTNYSGNIKTWNRAASEIFKYNSKELIDKSCETIFSNLSKTEFSTRLNLCLDKQVKDRRADLIEFEGVRSNGEVFPVEVSFSSWRIEEGVFASVVIRDITERRKTEQLKNEFVSTVSHELRTPLTAIMGSLQLITGGVLGSISPKIKDLLEVAVSNSERLLLIINDILDMNKIESNNMNFNIQRVEVMKLVTQAITENQSYATKNNAFIELTESVSNKYIDTDRARMLQVLANLLSNAAKFSPDKGVIKVAVVDNNDTIRISVQDNGSGIPDEFRERIFQKFAQADSTDTRAPGGTGLGLSITKNLIEQMGGKIDFESEPNIKTTFYVDLECQQRIE